MLLLYIKVKILHALDFCSQYNGIDVELYGLEDGGIVATFEARKRYFIILSAYPVESCFIVDLFDWMETP